MIIENFYVFVKLLKLQGYAEAVGYAQVVMAVPCIVIGESVIQAVVAPSKAGA